MKTTNSTAKQTKRAFSYLRWSTPRQDWGDSERRQSELARHYCESNGLTLCEQVADRGISAFHGLNRENGLKKLTEAMKPGDALLVEDCDRLSRQGWLETCILINGFLQRGIEVVTLRNGARIDRESFARNPGAFLPVIFAGHLGNDESAKKSFRIRQAWEGKRRAVAEGEAVRQSLPGWLEFDKTRDRKQTPLPLLIPEKAAVVKKMFAWALQGYGCLVIARRLRDEGIPSISKRHESKWHTDYVHKILTNKACIGYYTHVEPPKAGIYPPVIDEATFYAVQNALKSRGKNNGVTVRASSEANNLFTKIALCKACGAPLVMHRQGGKYSYLICGGTRKFEKNMRSQCGMEGFSYPKFEASIMEILSAVDKLRTQMEEKSGPSQADMLTAKLNALEAEGEKIMQMIGDDATPPRKLYDRMKALQIEEDQVREQVMAAKAKESAASAGLSWGQFRKLLPEKLSDHDFRLRLKTAVRAVVESVTVDLPAKTFSMKLKDYSVPITVELEGNNLHYVVTTATKDKSLGCCCPLSARWKVPVRKAG